MCACGGSSNVQAILNSAYVLVTFDVAQVAYRGNITGRLYGDIDSGDVVKIQIVDFDNSIMTMT
jgi:translation initiation factor IF-1